MIKTYNPTNGDLLQEYKEDSQNVLNEKIQQAVEAQKKWASLNITERLEGLDQVRNKLIRSKETISDLITQEMGKPLSQSMAEVDKCVKLCDYYIENSPHYLKDENISSDHKSSYVTFQPLGVVLSIMPWNFPIWQVFRFIVPSLVVRNSALLKHASNVTGTSLAIADLFCTDSIPKNLFQSLVISGEVASKIIADPNVAAVTFTGSTKVGKSIAKIAGENLKKMVLELGGSDPYIICKDADLELAARLTVKSRLLNTGQSCIAAKRFIVEEAVIEDFTTKMIEEVKQYQFTTHGKGDLGPLAKPDFVVDLQEQYDDAIAKGASLALEIKAPEGKSFAPVRVLTSCTEDMKVFKEETFGPLVCIFSAKDLDAAVAMANKSNFGLGAAIFSEDRKKAEAIAKNDLMAGTVAVNDFVKSDPRLPFGGIKESGIGRELSHYGLKEFVNIKTISLD